MHIITRKRLNEYVAKHPDAKSSCEHWYRVMKKSEHSNFAELKKTFASVDQVGKFTVFDIGGNKVRLIAAIHYNRKRVYIRYVLTHKEYDKGKWKE